MVTFLRACSFALILQLCSCGGGSGGASSGGNGGGPTAPRLFPTLVTSPNFQLSPITEPPNRIAASGIERGQLRTSATGSPAAGVAIEVLDAAEPEAPRVLTTATTDGSGAFSVSADLSAVAPANRWLRANLGGGITLRAFATGWTEITPATDVAVGEIVRLRKAGRFANVTTGALSASQESLSLMWLGSYGSLAPVAAKESLLAEVRFQAAWNRWLDRLSRGLTTGTGDIAGVVPVSDLSWLSSVRKGGAAPNAAVLQSACDAGLSSDVNNCTISSVSDPDVREAFTLSLAGAKLREELVSGDVLSNLLAQVGELPLIEFPPAIGTSVLFNDPQLVLRAAPDIHASVKVTRRTYPAQAVAALGALPQAIRVVLDYEIAVLNTQTSEQADLIAREQRWFTPRGGRIRIEAQALARSGMQISSDSLSVNANEVSGATFLAPMISFAGVADAQALALRHFHAVHAAASNRVYAATPDDGGKILELDGDTLTALRSIAVGTVPRRVAVSLDGQRLFAGLDDGSVAEWDLTTLAQVSRSAPMVDPYGVLIDRVFDLSIDPFETRRVLALVGASSVSGHGGVVLLRDGNLLMRDAPRFNAFGWGWGYYSPLAVAWSSVPNEFLAPGIRGTNQLNRFSIGTTSFGEVLSIDLGEEIGWNEVAGEIVTDKGSVINASSLTKSRALTVTPLGLRSCTRFDLSASVCRFKDDAFAPPNILLLNQSTSDFVGVYQPAVTTVTNGCPERGVRVDSLGLDDLQVTGIGNGRLLASSLSAGTDGSQRCNLQVWKLRGVAPQ